MNTPLKGRDKVLHEASRQAEICNACRYCEGYCAVFPALMRDTVFSHGAMTHLANLCHNCRGCYYACQYAPPHEFAVNLPGILARMRSVSWQELAWPRNFGRAFNQSGLLITVLCFLCISFIIFIAQMLGAQEGEGFYAVMSHGVMISIFIPAFLLPFFSLGYSLHKYWQLVEGEFIRPRHIAAAMRSALTMKNLDGGHGDGCNYEQEDRFGQARKYAHHMIFYGFMMCFASTISATFLHYVFDLPAPYPLFSIPKLFGVPGGILLGGGSLWYMYLKCLADKSLGDARAWSGEMAIVAILGIVAISGLLLYVWGNTSWMPALLSLHLGSVLCLFLITPYSKMAHGFYRVAALIREAQYLDTQNHGKSPTT
ncbi:MAG: tricarballylate utilization 4Fe-4S protein TcuB [Pseudomonadota bacterium]